MMTLVFLIYSRHGCNSDAKVRKFRPLTSMPGPEFIAFATLFDVGQNYLVMMPILVARMNSMMWRMNGPSGTCCSIWLTASNTDVLPWNSRR